MMHDACCRMMHEEVPRKPQDEECSLHVDGSGEISATVRMHDGVPEYRLMPASCLFDIWMPYSYLGSQPGILAGSDLIRTPPKTRPLQTFRWDPPPQRPT